MVTKGYQWNFQNFNYYLSIEGHSFGQQHTLGTVADIRIFSSTVGTKIATGLYHL